MSDRPDGVFRRDGPILALFLALTVVMTNPLVLHLADAVEDKVDALLNTWIIAWVGHALIDDPLHLFDANIFYPYHNALAFSEVMLPQGLLALPINLASGNTVLGNNLVLVFSFLLAAYAMYLLVFDLTHQRVAGIVAGLVFAFNPYNLGNLAQVQLLSFGWMPLALLFLRRTINSSQLTTSNRKRGTRDSFLFALFFSLQVLSSIYYGFLAGIAVVLYVFWSLITYHTSRISPNRRRSAAFYVSLFIRLSISAIIIAILVVPVLLPYLQVQQELGFQRNLEESEQFSASLKLFTEVSARNVIYGSFLSPRPPIIAGGYPQDNLFPGLVPLILAVLGILASRNRERWFYFCLLLFAFILSLGPRLFITPSLRTSITLPYRWLYDVIPLVHALRAPVRFDALVILALAVLAGMGMQAVGRGKQAAASRKLAEDGKQKAAGLLVPSAFCLLILIEYLAVPAANVTPVPVGDAIPPYVHWLAQQPRATILELPMIENECACLVDLTPQYLSTYHWQRTPDGYSGFDPKPHGAITYEMQFFPNDRTDALLRALDVRYVVVHGNRIDNWTSRRQKIGDASGLKLVQQFGEDEVYMITPRAEGPALLNAEPYLPSPVAPNADFTAYVIVQNHRGHSAAIKPTDALIVEARWSNGGIQRVSTSMPLVTSSVSVVPVTLRAPPQVGSYRLSMHISETGLGVWDMAGDVSVRDEEPAHQVVLPARVMMDSPLKAVYAPGDIIKVGVTWQALNKIDDYYSASVRVVDAQGNKKTDAGDREPAEKTMLWVPGSEVRDRFSLTLPPDLAPGEYSVQLLMYQANLGIDALLLDDQFVPRETVELGKFTVK